MKKWKLKVLIEFKIYFRFKNELIIRFKFVKYELRDIARYNLF